MDREQDKNIAADVRAAQRALDGISRQANLQQGFSLQEIHDAMEGLDENATAIDVASAVLAKKGMDPTLLDWNSIADWMQAIDVPLDNNGTIAPTSLAAVQAHIKAAGGNVPRELRKVLGVNKPIRNETTTSRNDACPCGSGRKFKKCCMGKEKEEKKK